MLTESDRAAIAILASVIDDVAADNVMHPFQGFQAIKILHHAIRHLAYPYRDVYPKTRKGNKRYPVVIDHGRRIDLR